MTDLSSEFHPVPKPHTKEKKSKSKHIAPGKKTREWETVRVDLKAQFVIKNITSCEIQHSGCWHNNALTFAHIDKRRFLNKEDLYKVVLACTPCHQWVEALPRLEMRKILLNIIANRVK